MRKANTCIVCCLTLSFATLSFAEWTLPARRRVRKGFPADRGRSLSESYSYGSYSYSYG